jgi:hypothetical protein
LNPRATTTFSVGLEFSTAAAYLITIGLENASGASLRTNSFPLEIS